MKNALGVLEVVLIVALVCVISVSGYTVLNNLKLNLFNMTKVKTTNIVAIVPSSSQDGNIGNPNIVVDSGNEDNQSDPNNLNQDEPISNNVTIKTSNVSTENNSSPVETTGILASNQTSSTVTSSSSAATNNSNKSTETVGATASSGNNIIDAIINAGNIIAGAFNSIMNMIKP